MERQGTRFYRLAVYLAPWMPGAQVEDVLEDYDEYLRHLAPLRAEESPLEFGRDVLRHRLSRRPALRAVLALAAAAALLAAAAVFGRHGAYTQKLWSLAALAVGLPVALWQLAGGAAAARHSPATQSRLPLVMALATALTAVAVLQLWLRLLEGAARGLPPAAVGALMGALVRAGQMIAVVLLAFAVWRTLRRAAWYVCLQAQAVALWALFRSVHCLMHDMSAETAGHPMPNLLPFLLGWLTALGLWVVLRRLNGKGADHGRADEKGDP